VTLPLVEVEWWDAAGGGGWKPLEEIRREAQVDPCRSVGYVVRDDEDALVICQSVTERDVEGAEQFANDWVAIPRESVERVTRLRE
jgi:hypothetical protein